MGAGQLRQPPFKVAETSMRQEQEDHAFILQPSCPALIGLLVSLAASTTYNGPGVPYPNPPLPSPPTLSCSTPPPSPPTLPTHPSVQ